MATPVAANVEELLTEAASQEAAALLARLASLPGVSGVNPKPLSNASKLNHFGVSYKLRFPGGSRDSKRSAVTAPDGDRPTFVAAVQHAVDATVAVNQLLQNAEQCRRWRSSNG